MVVTLGLGGASNAGKEQLPVMVYIHCQPETAQDERQLFAWRVLQQALERTRPAYGEFVLKEASVSLRQPRQLQAIERGGRDINVALLPVMPESARSTVTPVRIPAIGGLWGYRVLLVAADRQARFDAIRTLDDLRSITIGQSWFWADTGILLKAGLQVVTGEAYDGLFKMLVAGRFDAFSRSVIEAAPEYEVRRDLLPKMAIERHLLLHYPMPEYFWFSDDAEGRRRAQRVRDGLMSMVEDRSLCRMVEKQFGESIRTLALDQRTVIEIPNSLMGPGDHLDEPAYWCDPIAYKSTSQP